jgi:hypothetical protein
VKKLTLMRESDQAYGRVEAFFHVAGYTIAKAFQDMEFLLDEKNRWKEFGFDDVNAFLASFNFKEIEANFATRKRLAKRIKELQPAAHNRQIARTVGIDEGTIRADKSAKARAKTKIKQREAADASAGNRQSGYDAWKAAERAAIKVASQAAAEERRERSRNAMPLIDGMDLRTGDCRKVLADVANNSVALVLTDPPYEESAEPLYHWLAEWSARVLVPGGSLVCLTGHWSLNRDMEIFDKHLRYWWVMAMMHTVSRRLPGKFVIAGFKPILWYVKENRRGKVLIPDVLRSEGRDKDAHEWGQGEAGFTPLIRDLTEPGELIIDPFAGAATWGYIAANMGRRWIGSDIVKGGSTDVQVVEAAE